MENKMKRVVQSSVHFSALKDDNPVERMNTVGPNMPCDEACCTQHNMVSSRLPKVLRFAASTYMVKPGERNVAAAVVDVDVFVSEKRPSKELVVQTEFKQIAGLTQTTLKKECSCFPSARPHKDQPGPCQISKYPWLRKLVAWSCFR